MQRMKLRLIAMGCIISVLGGILYVFRGYQPLLLALVGVGMVLLVVGLLWKSPKKSV